jgi:hypothetical protein
VGTFGNSGRNNVEGPGFFQVDAALVRDFKVKERYTLELRAEAFNLPNSRRSGISGPNLAAGASGLNLTLGTGGAPGTIGAFGTQTNSLDPRILQMAMKFVF